MQVTPEIFPDNGMALEGKDHRIRIKQKHPSPPKALPNFFLPL